MADGHACGNEHSHGHGHGHDHGHDHDHDHGDGLNGEEWSLYLQVDETQCMALNEAEPNSLQHILRPWHARSDETLPIMKSDADEQLLIKVAFVSPVNIRSICVIGAGDRENPSTIKAFVNVNTPLDFSLAEQMAATQTFELVERNPTGDVQYPTNFAKFQNVTNLWLFVARNFGADVTEIRYLGFKGTFTQYKREAVITVYESRPMKAAEDVKNASTQQRMGM